MHNCPITACVAWCEYNKLMCRTHWRLVPGDLQRDVWSAWNKYQDGRGFDPERLKALRAAQEKAIAAVEEKVKGEAAA